MALRTDVPKNLPRGNTYSRKTGLGVPAGRGIRNEFDKYPTPDGALEDLMAREKVRGPIWECAAGNGDVHRRLEAMGHEVISTELHAEGWGETGVDFFKERRLRAPNIITNPPFGQWKEFASHAMEGMDRRPRFLALFGRTLLLEGIKRTEILERTNLAHVWVFRRRLDGNPRWFETKMKVISYSWFVWRAGHKGPPTLGWL